MFDRHDELLSLATLWTAALATTAVALRGASPLLAILSLPLLIVAARMTVLHRRRVRPGKPTIRGGPSHAGARVIRLWPRPSVAPRRRSRAA